MRFRILFAALTLSPSAFATNVTEFPDNGSEQMARGGAWVARASDPLAAFYNPAGLAGQKTRATLQANLVIQQTCFSRLAAVNDTTQDPLVDPMTRKFPTVCNAGDPQFPPNLQLGMTYAITEKLGVSFVFLAPSGVAKSTWPETITTTDSQGRMVSGGAPQRYLLLSGDAFFITPTLGVGYEIFPGVRIGAAFILGTAPSLKFASTPISINQDNQSPRNNDMKAELTLHDYFVPGATFGALYSPSDNVDLAGWFKIQKSIEASGDLKLSKDYFQPNVMAGKAQPYVTDSSQPDCGYTPGTDLNQKNCAPNAVKVTVPIPMEFKIGVRVHETRGAMGHLRDPLKQDKWDAELDFTWAHNGDFDALHIRFPAAMPGSPDGALPVNGIPSNPIPAIADIPHGYKDVIGVRFGGDIVLKPDVLAVRAGGFVESRAQDQRYQNIDFMGAARAGISVGGTYRLHLSKVKDNALEFHLGLMHMFVFDQSYDGTVGVLGLAGTACNPPNATAGLNCPNGNPKYRTNWPVNLGTITNQLTAFNVGVSYKF